MALCGKAAHQHSPQLRPRLGRPPHSSTGQDGGPCRVLMLLQSSLHAPSQALQLRWTRERRRRSRGSRSSSPSFKGCSELAQRLGVGLDSLGERAEIRQGSRGSRGSRGSCRGSSWKGGCKGSSGKASSSTSRQRCRVSSWGSSFSQWGVGCRPAQGRPLQVWEANTSQAAGVRPLS